jgi:hypothetical protein
MRENTALEFKIYCFCVFDELLKAKKTKTKESILGTSDTEKENKCITKHLSSPVFTVLAAVCLH